MARHQLGLDRARILDSADLQRGLALAIHTLHLAPEGVARVHRPSATAQALGRRARVAWLTEELLWMRKVIDTETRA